MRADRRGGAGATRVKLHAGGLTFEGVAGERLLDACQRAGLPLEGTCGGDMACGTCHVLIAAGDAQRLPSASADEEDMLDLLPRARATSRLACQIVLADTLGELSLTLP